MTTQQPEALRLAELLELAPEDGIEPQTAEDAAAGLRRLHSENESLQAGYAAARLEIESLQARIKTMAEEHADELMVAHMDGIMRAALAAAPAQPAPQQEVQEPVAWYVTGCGRLLDEDEAKAEARHIGGTAMAMPLYTAPQADSVTAPATGAVAHTLSDAQIEAMPVWRNFVGLWPESRREIVDAVVDLLAAAPTPPAQAAESVPAIYDLPPLPDPDLRDVGTKPQDVKDFLNGYATEYARLALAARAPADSVLEDAARYRWLRQHDGVDCTDDGEFIAGALSGITIGIDASCAQGIDGADLDAAIDAARKQGANHD